MRQVELGKLIEGAAFRDCVHVAVLPVEALENLEPGTHVIVLTEPTAPGSYLARAGADGEECLGIVDPFLRGPVPKGARFYVFVYPGTITDMRHAWQHPLLRSSMKTSEGGA